ncbi:MAG: hypothetical protein ABEJ31_00500 [Haloarculaceae archaeon]
MSDEPDPQTKAELRAALDALILRAYANGIAVDDTGFTLRHDGHEAPDWGVQIFRVTKNPDAEE